MPKELNENTGFNVSIKTLISVLEQQWQQLLVCGLCYKQTYNEAKDLPKNEWNPEWLEKLPPPSITRMEFDMKDQLVRQTIMTTQEDVKEIKAQLEKLNDKIDALR